MLKVTVLGAGGWGMALAIGAFNKGCDVTLWSPFKDEVELLLKNFLHHTTQSFYFLI